MKRILIPTDFSSEAGQTLEYVLNLFSKTAAPCRIILLHTYIFQQTDRDKVMVMNDELKWLSREGLSKQRSHAMKNIQNSHITIETISQFGTLRNVVFHLLQKGEVDLVAMGKDEDTKLEQISTLLLDYNCPLLIS